MKLYEKNRNKAIDEDNKCKQKIYQAKEKGHWDLAKELGTKGASPMTAVKRPKRGPEGQAKGTVATNPKEVDAIVRDAYGRIYAGNIKDGKEMTSRYLRTYGKSYYKAKKTQAESPTGPELAAAAVDANESGAGGDQ